MEPFHEGRRVKLTIDQDRGDWSHHAFFFFNPLSAPPTTWSPTWHYVNHNTEDRVSSGLFVSFHVHVCVRGRVCTLTDTPPTWRPTPLHMIHVWYLFLQLGAKPEQWGTMQVQVWIMGMGFSLSTVWLPHRVSDAGVERSKVPLHDPACLSNRTAWIIASPKAGR